MWDTARHASRVCTPILPAVKQQTSLARSASYKTARFSIMVKLKQFVRLFPLINHQAVPGAETADLLYMWGAFPKMTNQPFVIELDNPFVLSYYSQRFFNWRLLAIKRKLRRANYITYLSETARNHTLELIGPEFAEKSKVLPPFMDKNYLYNKRPGDGIVRFLFVGLGFRRKGGPELLKAFAALPNENAQLTIVAPVPEEVKSAYAYDKRIIFLPPQPREVLFTKLYPESDIFVFPSILETLGVVILEALSFGMGIITTDSYATPEMVKNDVNGRLLSHPFLKKTLLNGVPTIDCVTIPRDEFTAKYQQDEHFYETLSSDTLTAMTEAMNQTKVWQDASIELFDRRFSPDLWEQKLVEILSPVSTDA